ncbi:MAG: hypothetical protein ABTD50_22900 [Polyangiaceae bacterium]|jgi:hypothetical protein
MNIYSVERGGRIFFVRAEWDPTAGQFKSTDVPLEVAQSVTGYRYTFARTIEGLVANGVRVYPSLEQARRRAS